MLAVFRDAAQTVANEVRRPVAAGGNMPVKTGNLRRSLMASTSAMPLVRTGDDQVFSDNEEQINLVIAGANIGQTIYLGFQANYARHMEYGTQPHVIEPRNAEALRWYAGGASVFAKRVQHPGTQPFAFVRKTAQNWPQIVAESAQRMQRRVEAREAFRSMKLE
ncbi:MAG: hypothetical protein IT540_15085 [Hyphomicrobium sp.]|nr:hypothetical protein [Hyphomicrobium sp.]